MHFEYRDPWTRHTKLVYTVTRIYESFESEIQQIDVFEAKDWGTVLALGGVTNVTDRDESSYHEMLAHVAVLAHPNPKRVLIIGGGDGGTLREVLRHPEVEQAVLVDIDGEVIRCAKQYFPHLAKAFKNPRAEVLVEDGLAYVKRAKEAGESFDVILVDSTDPVDGAVELFTEAFYRDCAAVLGEQGILVPQSDSPVFFPDRVKHIVDTLGGIFANTRLYVGQCVAYPSGFWAFCAASQGVDVGTVSVDPERVARLEPQLRYMNADMFRACFALPTYIRRALAGDLRRGEPTLGDDADTMDIPDTDD